jgi:hypothetical protein
MVRDARRCRAPHHEGFEDLILRGAKRAQSHRRFSGHRSKTFASDVPGHDPRNLPLVRIGKSELVIASVSNAPYDETRQASRPGLARPSTSS